MSRLLVLLFVGVVFCDIKHQKAELTEICNQIQSKNLLPYGISKEFDNYLLEIATKNQRIKNEMMIIGSIGSLFLAPLVAPLFAAPGLYGAAAFSSGLATLGGGSIAAGGFGMLGGQVVLGLSSTVLTSTAISYSGYESSFDEFMKTKRNIYEDFIIIGDYQISGTFVYSDYNNSLNGYAKITKNGILVFTGSIFCEEKCSLLGKF